MNHPTVLLDHSDFLVLNKPAGWYTIPAREPKTSDAVLTEWIQTTLGVQPWVVHRLDRFTSGVILFAKSKEAHQQANTWFEKRVVKKTYHFLAAPLAGSPILSKPALQMKTPIDGKPSQTLFEVIKRAEKFFYGKATPLTGRFHQVREHAQEGGFPLLGDASYGYHAKEVGIDFPRVALHAYELALPFATVVAPLPSDMAQVISEMGAT